jgi:hypothetical protein
MKRKNRREEATTSMVSGQVVVVVLFLLNQVFPNIVILSYSLDLNFNKSSIKISQYNVMLERIKGISIKYRKHKTPTDQ